MPDTLSQNQLRGFLSTARKAALSGGKRALKYFRTNLAVARKVDRSPVTRADQEAEKVIRGILQKAYPGHQLCGEEFGWEKNTNAEFKWWIDPVDGTRQYIRGIPLWGTLLALEHRGEVVAGVIYHPALGLTLSAAKGLGCTVKGPGKSPAVRAKVSKIPDLKSGTLTYGGMRLVPRSYQGKLARLIETCYDDRGFGDCFGHTLVIQGMVEAMLDPVVQPYDVAAVKICVEEAGGLFTDLSGKKTIYGGSVLTSNGLVHWRILKAIRPA